MIGREPEHKMRPSREIEATTIHEAVLETAGLFPQRVALMYKDDAGVYQSITYGELRDSVAQAAESLRKLGIRKDDRVAICAYHGPDWVIADLAILKLGAIVVPIYHTLTPSAIAYILRDSGSKLVFAEDAKILASIQSVRGDVAQLRTVVVFDTKNLERSTGFLSFSDLKSGGGNLICESARMNDAPPTVRVAPDDVATIVYTSGTTGEPKGVVLSHANIVSNAKAGVKRFRVTPDDVLLSFLPLCHMLERTAGCYSMLFAGATIAYATGVGTVAEDALRIRPTILVVVPRVMEKTYELVEKRVAESSCFRRQLMLAAVENLNRCCNLKYKELPVPLSLRLKCLYYDRLVASKFRKLTGGRLRLLISAGAPLDRRLAKTLWVLGFPIVEGYGLTETSPTVAVATPEDNRLGTTGKPIDNVEVKIGEHDEIMVRGPNVMRGYYNKPDATAAAIDMEGWFHTGDRGRFDERGNLVITGRLKEIIVTSYGKNVAPLQIEFELVRSPYIDQVMLCGDRQKFITALIVPAKESVKRFADETMLGWVDYPDLVRKDEVKRLIAREIEKATAKCAPFEKIKAFVLLPEGFTTENDLLTPTLKLRRSKIAEKYTAEITSMYAGGSGT